MNIEYGLPCPILSTQATVSQPPNDGGITDTLVFTDRDGSLEKLNKLPEVTQILSADTRFEIIFA